MTNHAQERSNKYVSALSSCYGNIQKIVSGISCIEISGLILVSIFAFWGLYYGWKLYWFLTDDAFIAFRYVSNSVLGYGYVWNPPPFTPVEGYTSFLWVFLLDIVWRVSGIMPPDSANWISFLFSCFTLVLGIIMCYRLDWKFNFKIYRLIFLILFLITLLTNPTFLIWTSSGLETAMFNFLLLFWVFSNYYLKSYSRPWLWSVSISTALLSLTRPDGLLVAVASVFMISVILYRKWSAKLTLARDMLAILPLGVIPLHLLWRKWTYGEWLPNTYYAKSAPNIIWVKSGIQYLLSFIIEYSLWFYLGLVFVVAVLVLLRWRVKKVSFFAWVSEVSNLTKIIPLLVLLAQFFYYTFVIGGDYFEYRIYSYLIFLIFFSAIWLLNYIGIKPLLAILFYIVLIVASWPIPWANWYFTHNMTNRVETRGLTISLANTVQRKIPSTPDFVLSYLGYYDGLQAWLINHYVCIRYQEHKVLWQTLVEYYPSREKGSLVTNDGFPATTQQAVGILSWALPHVNIIDLLGLNDYVIARNPDLDSRMHMAHLRQPPEGYIECFDPNIKVSKNNVSVKPRVEPMTEARIVFCETFYSQQIENALRK